MQVSLALLSCCAALIGALTFGLHERALTSRFITEIATSHSSVTVLGVVVKDPSYTKERVIGSSLRSSELTYVVRASEIRVNSDKSAGTIFHTRLPLRVFGGTKVELGETLQIAGRISVARDHRVSGNISAQKLTHIHNPTPLFHVMNLLRSDFREVAASFHSDAGALIPGMVLGDTSLQSSEFQKIMRRVGLTHITAVSGANFVLVATFLEWLLQWFIRRKFSRVLITGLTLALFILLVRPSPSVLRAAVMVGVVLIARLQRSSSVGIAALGCAITVLLLCDPFQALEPGFALSVLATSGILFLAPKFEEKLTDRGTPKVLSAALAIPLAATILCTPVIVAISGQLSLISIPVNMAVAPLIAPITIVGFIGVLVTICSTSLARLLLKLAIIPTEIIVQIARRAAHVPAVKISLALLVSIFLLSTIHLITKKINGVRRFLSLLIIIVLLVEIPRLQTFPSVNWQLFQCDVGQGDALVYRTNGNHALLIDTGPDPDLIDRCLSQLHITNIDLLILTHSHADHVNGLSGVQRGRKIHSVWANFNCDIEHHQVFQGEKYSLAGLSISVLWPTRQSINAQHFGTNAIHGDGSDENNKSITVLISSAPSSGQNVTLLATGDIEPEAQSEIARTFTQKINILKVAHHGSRYQDFTWLNQLRPDLALISVGAGNSYGQPSPTTVAALSQLNARILRTDKDGAVEVKWSYDSTQLRISINREGHSWWRVRWA